MENRQATPLGKFVHEKRLQLGLSINEVARRTGLDKAALSRVETGTQPRLGPDSLKALAPVLETPLADLYAAADYLPATELPSITPYMRAKYQDLPDQAVAEVEAFIKQLTDKHGTGPINNEDEA